MKAIIIDDEIWIREGLKVQIPWDALDITLAGEASNGVEGLQLIEEVKPDIVLTDIAMPLMNGLELMETIRTRYPNMTVIVISGYAEFEYARKALIYDASDYILKPFDEEALIESMRKAKRKVLATNSDPVEPGAVYRRLSEMLHHGCEEKDMKAVLDSAGIRITLPARVTVVQLTGEERENARRFVDDMERKISIDLKHPVVFQDPYEPQRVIMCTPVLPLSAAEQWFEGYEEIKIGAGGIADSLSQLKISYEQACQGMKYSGWLPGRKIVAYEAIQERKKNLVLPDEIVNDFIKRLETGERDRLLPWYFTWLEQQAAVPDIALESIQKSVLELMLAVAKSNRKNEVDLSNLFDRHETLAIALESDTYTKFKHRFSAFIEEVLRTVQSHATGGTKRTIEEIKAYIDEHYTEEISLNWVAEHFFINPAYLSRTFKREYGQNFNEYIMQLRMSKASRLLADGSLKLELISQMCGFENPKYFFKRFKLFFGCTPSEYRKRRLPSSSQAND
ncbi:response regulator [Paenibacillus sp. sptzw28]|uniref:response regulator n=1 Tax=Paenibacillus sp. sptzw28 TaxID=715179 RepID=UPI001C6E4A3D|nr:response regulator [Paenibacillus sp. sptzw28]QYR20588.1 response regulator [Paenibacillus sp. sptzw28]